MAHKGRKSKYRKRLNLKVILVIALPFLVLGLLLCTEGLTLLINSELETQSINNTRGNLLTNDVDRTGILSEIYIGMLSISSGLIFLYGEIKRPMWYLESFLRWDLHHYKYAPLNKPVYTALVVALINLCVLLALLVITRAF